MLSDKARDRLEEAKRLITDVLDEEGHKLDLRAVSVYDMMIQGINTLERYWEYDTRVG